MSGDGERPESDAGQLREAAAWLDTMDAMARAFFDMVQRSTLSEEMRERALSLIPDVSSDEVQQDLRRIADQLDAREGEVAMIVPESVARDLWRMGEWPDSTDLALQLAAARALGLSTDGLG